MLGFNVELKNIPKREQKVSIPLTWISPGSNKTGHLPNSSRAKNDQKTVGIETQNRRVRGTTKSVVTSTAPTPLSFASQFWDPLPSHLLPAGGLRLALPSPAWLPLQDTLSLPQMDLGWVCVWHLLGGDRRPPARALRTPPSRRGHRERPAPIVRANTWKGHTFLQNLSDYFSLHVCISWTKTEVIMLFFFFKSVHWLLGSFFCELLVYVPCLDDHSAAGF